MYVCMYVYVYTYIHIYVRMHILTYICTYAFIRMYVCTYIHMYVCPSRPYTVHLRRHAYVDELVSLGANVNLRSGDDAETPLIRAAVVGDALG